MPTIKKKVRKLEAQDGTESRRLWWHLTVALRNNNLENATASKHEVGSKINWAPLIVYLLVLSRVQSCTFCHTIYSWSKAVEVGGLKFWTLHRN